MTILLGLSGGVDSAVAAHCLQQAGFGVRALFMKNWEEDDDAEYCAAAEDLADAQAICAQLDIPLETRNFAAEYWERVFTDFLAEYQAGRTPSPDIVCNRVIKFPSFLDHAAAIGATTIATGHYAGTRQGATVELLKAADATKDQTYFLHRLTQEQLRAVQFPLHTLHKEAVREQARALGLPVHDKKDSTGLCFIGERRFRDFLARFLPPQPGPIVDERGVVLGEHTGLHFYTFGQRSGLQIGGVADAADSPWYVLAKDAAANTLTVTQDRAHPGLNVTRITIETPHWISGAPPAESVALTARIRHGQPEQPCQWEADRVTFRDTQWAPAPGQSVVFYAGDVCLGGAVIAGMG